jgi:c-di-GMP-binding flagellar brake protein YcgR
MSNKIDIKKIVPGLVVELVVLEGEYEGKYRTRIEEVGERVLSIGAPIEHGEVVPLRQGTKVKILFWDEVSAYSFTAKIMQRIAVPIHMFVLELPDSIAKVQRRNFVRVPAFYPLTFQTVTKEGLSDSKQGTMLDISGGGTRFLTEEQVDNKALLYARLALPNGDLQTPLRVCRVDKLEDTKPQRYCVSVEFYEIPERDRDRVVRIVFDIQRTLRKKGLV